MQPLKKYKINEKDQCLLAENFAFFGYGKGYGGVDQITY